MSKKNKAKFKRQLRSQIIQELSKENTQSPTHAATVTTVAASSNEKPADATSASQPSQVKEINLKQLRTDLWRTTFVIAILALAIGTLAFFDTKNAILAQFGDWIFKAFNIN